MKKISFALCLIMTMLCSCEEYEIINDNKLLGEWQPLLSEYCDKKTGEVLFTEEYCAVGDFIIKQLSVSTSAFVLFEGDEYYDDYYIEDSEAYSYIVTDDIISLYFNGIWDFDFTIEKLTNRDLVLSYPDDFWYKNYRIDCIVKLYFKKH